MLLGVPEHRRSLPTDRVVVYTDGACSGNPGPGGWAWAVAPGAEPWGSGAEAHTTNQQMEIQAVLEALRFFAEGPVEVVSDSTYVVNCFRDRWYEGWMARGWKNSKKEPVANQDRWKPLVDIYRRRAGEITFRWVKGHSGDPMNDRVDRLAVDAAVTQCGGGSIGVVAPVTPDAGNPGRGGSDQESLF
jgi:ribonuclease HI